MTGLNFLDRELTALRLTPSVEPDLATGSLRVRLPLPLPPGIPTGAPDIALVQGSSPASSIVGAGWSLSLPGAVTVGPAHGVPSWTSQDGYLFGGDELVPWVRPDGSSRSQIKDGVVTQLWRLATNPDDVRLERRTDTNTGAVTWWSRDGGNVLTRYGDAASARVFDYNNPSRIAAWLPTFRVDPLGQAIAFEYVDEDFRGVDHSAASERGRLRKPQAQRYIKSIRFGNREPSGSVGPSADTTWNFVLVFDYGDHDPNTPTITPDRDWAVRPDPSSSCRLGFDVRTWRRCEAVHVFQRIGDNYERVSTTRLIYADPTTSVISHLVEVQHSAWREAGERSASVPPVRFRYADPAIDSHIGPRVQLPTSRQGLADVRTRWVDLYGDGLPGVLAEASTGWWYSRNLGAGHFASPLALAERPSTPLSAMALGDEDQDGNTDLATLIGRGAGRYQLDREQRTWSGYQARARTAHVEGIGSRVQRVDLDGDGRPDLVISEADHFLWYPSDAPEGLGEPRRIPKPRFAGAARELRPDPALDLLFADMNGDGLPDLVRVENGRVEYWPNQGNGQFGDSVVVDDAPTFTNRDDFDIRRLRLADLTGNGCPDLLYLDGEELSWWHNLGGNRLRFGGVRRGVPSLDKMTDLRVLEIYGDGRPALVWSSSAPTAEGVAALPLTGTTPPGRLVEIDDGSGLSIRVQWSTSGSHMIRDLLEGEEWATHLPQHVHVVDRIEIEDRVAGTLASTTLRYRDGHLDSEAREFRGFGCVDQLDVEVITNDPLAPTSVPRLTRTWHVVGAPDEQRAACTRSWDHGVLVGAPRVIGLDDPSLDAVRARRAVAGRPRRVEVFAAPGGSPDAVPLEVRSWTWEVQAAGGKTSIEDCPIRVLEREQVQALHEGDADDPRITRSLIIQTDDTGYPTLVAQIAHAREHVVAPGQETGGIELLESRVLHVDSDDRFERVIPVESRTLELLGVDPGTVQLQRLLADDVGSAVAAPFPHHTVPSGAVTTRLWSWERSFYYDDARTGILPLGEVGKRTFVHHESAAVFDKGWPATIYDGRVDDSRLVDEGYRVDEGYWWRDDPVHLWGSDSEFAPLLSTIRPDGTGPRFEYWDQVPIASIDAVGNRTEAEIDPYTRAPQRITDANGLVEEVEYDAFGVVTRHVRYGTVVEGGTNHRWGGEAIMSTPPRTLDDALADPETALGTSDTATWIDLDAPQREGLPAKILTLQRTGLLHDGAGGTASPEVQVQLTYLDGAGDALQSRLRVEPGNAVQRAADGTIDVDGAGVPVLKPTSDRWLVSGFEIKNRKGEVVRIHEPFFSSGAAFEGDGALLRLGVSTAYTYDALGRVARVDHPDGTLERNEYSAWQVRSYDRNDTAVGSAWGLVRSAQPPGSEGKAALESLRDHADTPTIVDLDAWGREVRVTTTGGIGTDDRINRTVYDGGGRAAQVIDARGLIASIEELGLDDEVVYQHSIDAGDTWLLSDAFGRSRHRWDSLGYHVETSFDSADRPLQERVRGNGLDHQVSTFEYGETAIDGAVRNARGRLIEARDGAGRQTILRYDPTGAPLESERQLRADFGGEPDWRSTETLSPEHFTSNATYDALGRLIRSTLPDGLLREVSWSIAGQMRSIALTGSDGTLVKTEVFADADHDAEGRRLSRSLGNGVTQDWTYELDTRRLARQRAVHGRKTLQDLQMSYDPMGNVLRVEDKVQEPGFAGALLQGLNTSAATTYRYDPHYRLTESKGRVHRSLLPTDNAPGSAGYRFSRRVPLNDGSQVERYTRTYEYDQSDNLLQVHHQGLTAQWTSRMWVSPTSNRSLPQRDLLGDNVNAPEDRFDDAGQLTKMDHLERVDWSWRGTLSRAEIIDRSASSGQNDAEYYTYGADQMRIRKVHHRLVNGSVETTETIYLDGCEVRRIRRGNKLTLERWTSHVHDENGRVALIHRWSRDEHRRETDDTTQSRIHYILGNHQDSAVLELNEAGGLVSYEEYFPYGGTAFIAGDNERAIALRDYRYMGKERDTATGLSYFGHRYYAPWLYRWVSPDPTGMVDGTNLYGFVQGNPSTLLDMDGLQSTAAREQVLHHVPLKWDEEERVKQNFNQTKGLRLGIRALDLERRGDNWHIIRSEQIDPALLQMAQRNYELYESFQSLLDTLSSISPGASLSNAGLPGSAAAGLEQEGDGLANMGQTESGTSNGSGEQEENGSGNDSVSQGQNGSNGQGTQGSGPGGGGSSESSGDGGDEPKGSGGNNRVAGSGYSSTRGSGGNGNASVGRGRTPGGVPSGTRIIGPPGGMLGGTGEMSSTTGKQTSHDQGLSVGKGSKPAPPGAGPDGLDPNGSPTAPPGPPSPSTNGSPHGNPNSASDGSPSGEAGGTGTENGQEPRTAFDDIVCAAGYLNFEFCEGQEDGDRYGVPGGWLDWLPANRFMQGLYVALSVVALVEMLTGIGEAYLALKAGFTALRKIGLRGVLHLAAEKVAHGRNAFSNARAVFSRGGSSRALHSLDDPARALFGPGRVSHGKEFASGIEKARTLGVSVVQRPGALSYMPHVKQRRAGTLFLDPDASFSALQHELKHITDDADLGFLSQSILLQKETRWVMEELAYKVEINLAKRMAGFKTVAGSRATKAEIKTLIGQLEKNMTKEWMNIFKPMD